MKINLSYVAARDRETGEIGLLAQASSLSGGGDVSIVAACHEVLRGPSEEGAAMRAKYSHALFVLDNQERAAYEFPDPTVEERKALEAQLAEAKRKTADAARAVEASKAAAAAAKAAVKGKEDASDLVKQLEKQLAALAAPVAPAPAAPPQTKTNEPKGGENGGVLANLLKLGDEDLAKEGERLKVERKKDQPREEFAREIAKAAGYKLD